MTFRRRMILIMALLAMNSMNNKKHSETRVKGNTLNLPSFKNILEVKSSIRGRIRFYSPVMKSNDSLAYYLKDQVSKISVIKKCTINTLTGSILVEFDDTQVDAHTMEGAIIKLLGVDSKLSSGRESETMKFVKSGKEALNNGIYDFTNGILDSTTLFAAILLIGAILDYRKVGRRSMPGYPTLLWWVTRLL